MNHVEKLSRNSMEWLDAQIVAAERNVKRYAPGSRNHQLWMIKLLDARGAKAIKQQRIFDNVAGNRPLTF